MKKQTKREDGEDKVVPTPEVDFEEPAYEPAQNPEDEINWLYQDKDTANLMENLMDKVAPLFGSLFTTSDFSAGSRFNRSRIQYALPYFVHVRQTQQKSIVKVEFREDDRVLPLCLENFFDRKDLKDAGIDLNQITFKNINQYCPEFEEFRILPCYSYMTTDPFLAVLALPVEARPFFTGLLDMMIENRNITRPDVPDRAYKFNKAVTLDCALHYAAQKSMTPRVKKYMEMYAEI